MIILSHIYSDNKIFQSELKKRKELRKQKRNEFFNKIYTYFSKKHPVNN